MIFNISLQPSLVGLYCLFAALLNFQCFLALLLAVIVIHNCPPAMTQRFAIYGANVVCAYCIGYYLFHKWIRPQVSISLPKGVAVEPKWLYHQLKILRVFFLFRGFLLLSVGCSLAFGGITILWGVDAIEEALYYQVGIIWGITLFVCLIDYMCIFISNSFFKERSAKERVTLTLIVGTEQEMEENQKTEADIEVTLADASSHRSL